jgi:HTH-type transcriptional regulator/antitoxin HigA
MENLRWFLIETEQEYNLAITRYEEIKAASKGLPEHKEKLLLAHFISKYENNESELPDVDPVEMIKIRMEDFGYKVGA